MEEKLPQLLEFCKENETIVDIYFKVVNNNLSSRENKEIHLNKCSMVLILKT